MFTGTVPPDLLDEVAWSIFCRDNMSWVNRVTDPAEREIRGAYVAQLRAKHWD